MSMAMTPVYTFKCFFPSIFMICLRFQRSFTTIAKVTITFNETESMYQALKSSLPGVRSIPLLGLTIWVNVPIEEAIKKYQLNFERWLMG